MNLQKKISQSINLIQDYASIADKYGGYKVAFSGGKDSQVMLDLFRKSGVNFTAYYNVTTNDPPENIYFIRKNYQEVQFVHPKLTFLQLIERMGKLPLMDRRFCCKNLKECYLKGFVAVGVRREESQKRMKYDVIEFRSRTSRIWNESRMRRNRTVLVRPILDWSEVEVWQYIEDNNLPVNPCYENAGRVGCIFCPFASTRRLHWAKEKYPRYYRLLLRSIDRILRQGYLHEFGQLTAEKVFNWWASKKSSKEYFTQLDLFI